MAEQTETPAKRGRKPRVSILERRLQNPFGEPSQEIRFKDGKVITGRWFNEAARPGQVYRAKELGWQSVTPDMISDMNSLGFHAIDASGSIVRGERGAEHLMFMPSADYRQIQMAKTAENLRRMGNPGIVKKEVVEAASRNLGDEAAQFLNSQLREGAGPSGFVRDSKEIIAVDVEAQREAEK